MSAQHALPLPSSTQCALQLADGGGSARIVVAGLPVHHDRAEDGGRRGLCDGVPGGIGLRPASGRCASGRSVGAPLSSYQRRCVDGGDGRARSKGRMASRSMTDLCATSAQHRDAEEPGDEQSCDRAPVWDVTEIAIGKLVGRSKLDCEQLALFAIPTRQTHSLLGGVARVVWRSFGQRLCPVWASWEGTMVLGLVHGDRRSIRAAANAAGNRHGEARSGILPHPAPEVSATRGALLRGILG
jgi:hypothetical protein